MPPSAAAADGGLSSTSLWRHPASRTQGRCRPSCLSYGVVDQRTLSFSICLGKTTMRHPPVRNRVDGATAVTGLPARCGLALAALRRLRTSLFVLLLCFLQMFVPGYSLGLIH